MSSTAVALAAILFLHPAPASSTYTYAWSAIQPLPFGRSDETATTIGGLIYLAGGCDGAQTCDPVAGYCSCSALLDQLLAYNPATNSYASLAPMPRPRYRHLACAVGDTLYLFGGRTIPDDALILPVDAFNTTTGAWSTLPAAAAYPAELGSDNSCATVGASILVFGGYTPFYDATSNATFAFTPVTQAWARRAGTMPTHRGDYSSVALGGVVHVYGGYTPPEFCVPIASHDVYDPAADAWTTAAPMPDNLAEKDDGIVVGGRLYSIGGEKKAVTAGCVDQDITPLTEVFSFDPATGAWANETRLPDVRMRFASAAVGETAYVFGGQGALVDGDMLPVMYTAYACTFGAAAPGAGGAASAAVYTRGDMAGAVVGTLAATVAIGVVLGLAWRRARGGAAPGVDAGKAAAPPRRLSVASEA